VFGEVVAVDDGGGEVDEFAAAMRECSRSISEASSSLTEWRSMRMPVARSVITWRPNAPWRL
jgi:hypothetical protein